ncbi:hypothetical protein [Spirosoma endbachense]|uniref:BBC1/AIM3 cysteine proteinase-fold domain-containing protein n=1 Tax=Spirosoma endbachense TaxID=2666025 RepID=A0A6P1VWL7_9BACT|nr:hypothetical protein [Spirosoma endbachense]QHV96079.1 hypothetical protein GJR95_14155 [Spirosoma endbachense]
MGVNQVIVQYAANKVGHRDGDGQCWTLAEKALKNAHAKTSNDIMGADGVNSDADYVWGTETSLANLQPGDIVQFNYYTMHIDNADGSWREEGRGEPRHTAIVASVGAGGKVVVYEQNIPDGGPVKKSTLYFKNTDSVTLGGSWWFYRPIPK